MLECLKQKVLEANLLLPKYGLVLFTWGNASGIDEERKFVVIKASGVEYPDMNLKHMVVADLEGNIVEGGYRPSSDLPTHLVLYKNFGKIGGIVHTHSRNATEWAQAGREIPCYGTTHADYFYGNIPCTDAMSDEQIKGNYEAETGNCIVKRFEGLDYNGIPGVLVKNHGPFTWGKNPADAVQKAVILEEIALMAKDTVMLNDTIQSMPKALLDKHYLRKHGSNAYYGQGTVNHEV